MGVEQAGAEKGNIEHYDIDYGRKRLSLDINLQAGTASLRFGEGDWFHRHRLHETTIAFATADSILREVVNRERKLIILTFDTSNDKLKLWLKNKREILGLEVEQDNENSYRQTAYKTYMPDLK